MTESDALMRARALLEEPDTVASVKASASSTHPAASPGPWRALALSGVMAALAVSLAAVVIFAPPPPTEAIRR